MGPALSAVAALPPYRWRKERVPSTAVADRKSARRQAAPRLLKHAVSAPSTVRTDRAKLTAAPPTHTVVALHFAGNTVAESEQLRVGAAPPCC